MIEEELFAGIVDRVYKTPGDEEKYAVQINCDRWEGRVREDDVVSIMLVQTPNEVPIGVNVAIVLQYEGDGPQGDYKEHRCKACGLVFRFVDDSHNCPECFEPFEVADREFKVMDGSYYA